MLKSFNTDYIYSYTDDNPHSQEYYTFMGKKPLIKEYKYKNQSLIYVWFQHTQQLENPQIKILRSEFELFKTWPNKKIVFIEADIRYKPGTSFSSEEEAIEFYESGLIHFLSLQNNIPCIPLRVSIQDEIENLKNKHYSQSEIIFYSIWRSLRTTDKETFIRAVNNKRENIKNNFEEHSLNSWIETFKKVYKNVFKKTLTLNLKTIDAISDTATPSEKNKIATDANKVIEEKILTSITEYINLEYDVFCVYGAGHLLRQEKALDSIFN